MSTPSPPPAMEAPRQFTVHLPPEFYPKDYWDLEVASSSTHLVLGGNNSVWIYSLPAFDLVDTIYPGNLAEYDKTLRVYGRFLIVMCKAEVFEEGYLLYIWDFSTRKHIGTVKSNLIGGDFDTSAFVSLPSTDIPDHGQRSSSGWPQDPLLIVCSDTYVGSLATYVLNHPSAEHVEGGNERSQGPQLPMAPTMTIHGIHKVRCFASMGRTALTGGEDQTVRAWEVIIGKCQMVFVGHTERVRQVNLDAERIYSASDDHTIRVWDRYKGDCFHVLDVATSLAKIFVTSSYIIGEPDYSGLLIWDIVSGKLEHRLNEWIWDLGPIRGKERTLATIENDENPKTYWFRIRDLRSGQPIRTSSFQPGVLPQEWFFQGRFLIRRAEEDEKHVLKVWDFGANDAEDGEVRNNDDGNSRDNNATDKTEEVMGDDCGMSVSPSPSSSAVERVLPRNSKTTEKWKKRSVHHGQNSSGFNWREKYTKQGAGVELSAITALATLSANRT